MPEEPRKRRSCLARMFNSAVDGVILGGALGGIIASTRAFELGVSGGAGRFMLASSLRSGLSFAWFLASFNGGTCTLENMRGKRDVVNPFVVGGLMGVAGALPGYMTPMPHAPWTYRNNRALAGAGISSALLCSFFYFISSASREPAPEGTSLPSPGSGAPAGAPAYPTMPHPVMPQPTMPEPFSYAPAPEWEEPSTQATPDTAGGMMGSFGKEEIVDKWK
jgi:hypothetical protein